MVIVIRGVTQLACRLRTLGSPSRNWTSAARSSLKTLSLKTLCCPQFGRDSSSVRQETFRADHGAPSRARPGAKAELWPGDFWPGAKAELRPNASCPDGEPQAEPSMAVKIPVVLKKSRLAHFEKSESVDEYRSPLPCATDRLGGKDAPAPPYPLCDLGLEGEAADKVQKRPGSKDWRGAEFQLGRAPFDSKYCAVWHALFESFAPAQRVLAPVYRFLIRSRGAQLRGENVPDPKEVHQVAFDLGVSPAELESVLHAYVEDIPPHVVGTVAERKELVGEAGQLHPYGVVAGALFSMVTRASYGARLDWFQS